MAQMKDARPHHVVIVGGGFGGLYAAKALRRVPVQVTLVDKRNFHLFQPLLYQVATGILSPGDIASPLRAVLSRHKNASVLKAEVVDIDPIERRVILQDGALSYDSLIIATGASHHYFGHEEWAATAPGLKTVEDALDVRSRILLAFEAAEWEPDPEKRRAWMRFVVVGGGPTGVELAGAIAELTRTTLKDDFRHTNPKEAEILLLEGTNRILPTYPAKLSDQAEASLADLGVTVWTRSLVTDIQDDLVTVSTDRGVEHLPARTVLWAAGMKASPMAQVLAERTGAELDRSGRVKVAPDLSVPGYPTVFVIGDLAHFPQDSKPLPGIAPVAIQQGHYVANLIRKRLSGGASAGDTLVLPPFRYRNKGNLAVIGRNKAVAEIGPFKFWGVLAWFLWVFVHIGYLIEFDNKLLVLIQWAWNYFTRKRGARLITGEYLSTQEETPIVYPSLTDVRAQVTDARITT